MKRFPTDRTERTATLDDNQSNWNKYRQRQADLKVIKPKKFNLSSGIFSLFV
ncbi:hypothetical protein HOLleu_31005 [Holothuria leucospilota]|uniref:Uncharacterized protein n=1 Tax=Holothuria leucospilota TaxID=206669 RepID=A0A9Q1H115_HOLLE|nr:hypothetical protein HOLleu_31005 [Holothuria leucospilota]